MYECMEITYKVAPACQAQGNALTDTMVLWWLRRMAGRVREMQVLVRGEASLVGVGLHVHVCEL